MNTASMKAAQKTAKTPGGKFLALAAIAALSVGCAVGPDYQPPNFNLPGQWQNSEKSAPHNNISHGQNIIQTDTRQALAGWWRQLHDPELNSLIDMAMAENIGIATAKARLRAARALTYQTAGVLLPAADGSGGMTRRRQATGPTKDYYSGGFDAAWEVDIFGGNKRALEAAQAGFSAAASDLRANMVSLIAEVAANYVEIRRLQAQLRLSRDTAQSQRQTANLIARKYQSGAVAALDSYNSAGQAADMEANIPRFRQQLAIAEHRLALLLGQAPMSLDLLLQTASSHQKLPNKQASKLSRSNIPPVPQRLPQTLPADILRSRPDIAAAERRLAQATAGIGQKQAQLYPAISLTGNIATNSLHLGDLGKNSTIGWAFGPSLRLPLFHGGALRAGVEIARAERDQNFLALRSTVLTALEDVENALVTLRNMRLLAQKKAEAARAYRHSLQLSRDLYASGNNGFLDLLTAERSYFYAEQTMLDAKAETTTAYISLMKALGGGWDGTTDYLKPEITDSNTAPHFISSPAAISPSDQAGSSL